MVRIRRTGCDHILFPIKRVLSHKGVELGFLDILLGFVH
jgi:hypothetical protein